MNATARKNKYRTMFTRAARILLSLDRLFNAPVQKKKSLEKLPTLIRKPAEFSRRENKQLYSPSPTPPATTTRKKVKRVGR